MRASDRGNNRDGPACRGTPSPDSHPGPPMTLGNMHEEAEMTKREAIEKCARATVKRQGYREDQWRQYPTHVEFAENIVVALEALGLLKSSS